VVGLGLGLGVGLGASESLIADCRCRIRRIRYRLPVTDTRPIFFSMLQLNKHPELYERRSCHSLSFPVHVPVIDERRIDRCDCDC